MIYQESFESLELVKCRHKSSPVLIDFQMCYLS